MLRKNLIANFTGQIWAAAMGLIFLPMYLLNMGPEAYGVVGFYAVLQAVVTVFDFGLSPTMQRSASVYCSGEYSRCDFNDLLRTTEILSAVVSILITVLIFICANFIASNWLNTSSLEQVEILNAVNLIAIVISLRFMEGIYRGTMLGLQEHIALNTIFIVSTTLRWGGGALAILVIEPSLAVFFTWQAGVSVLTLIALANAVYKVTSFRFFDGRFSYTQLKRTLNFSAMMAVMSVLVMFTTQFDKIVLSSVLPLEEFAKYSFSYSLVLGLTFIVGPFGQVFYPKLTNYYSKSEDGRMMNTFHLSAKVVTVAVSPFAYTLILFPESVVFVWSGDIILATEIAPLISVLSLGTLFSCLVMMPYYFQLASDKPAKVVLVNLTIVIVVLPVMIYFVPSHGVMAAAWSWAVFNGLSLAINAHLLFRQFGLRDYFVWISRDILIPSAICITTLLILNTLWSFSELRYAVFLQLCVCAAISLLAMLVCTKDLRITMFSRQKLFV